MCGSAGEGGRVADGPSQGLLLFLNHSWSVGPPPHHENRPPRLWRQRSSHLRATHFHRKEVCLKIRAVAARLSTSHRRFASLKIRAVAARLSTSHRRFASLP